MNRIIISSILLLSLADAQAARIILDRIAVVVNEDLITYSEVQERIKSVKSQLSGKEDSPLPSDAIITDQVIERLIVETLQLKIGDRAGIRISDSELNQTLQAIGRTLDLNSHFFYMSD